MITNAKLIDEIEVELMKIECHLLKGYRTVLFQLVETDEISDLTKESIEVKIFHKIEFYKRIA
jgi:hypothetical protein